MVRAGAIAERAAPGPSAPPRAGTAGRPAPRVALVHYWLVTMRGGERVLEALCDLYPDADIYTHVYDPASVSEKIRRHRVHTSFIDRLPFSRRHYSAYLPLMPFALEQLDLSGYDLVISSESGPAKGVIVGENAVHLCYCHTPMRYLWNMYHEYRRTAGRLQRLVMPLVMPALRQWDAATAQRVDGFVANSRTVARRIAKYYRRDAVVINPPVRTEAFSVVPETGDYYLLLGQLVPYKRADLAVEAFNRLGRRLVVIGDGPDLKRLRAMAGGNVEILGPRPFAELKGWLERCRALVFPGEEDFGIVPVEAMAAGRPVIAYGRGGAAETVRHGETGLLFDEQTADALVDAVRSFEANADSFDRQAIRAWAEHFSEDRFKREMKAFIDAALEAHAGAGTHG